jgi:putative transposase
VLSDGTKVDAPRIARKAAAKLRRAQKELARRRRGSANRERSRRKVAKCHARVGDTRRDWLHKLSTTIVRENQAVYVEDLAVSGLARTRLARSVHDAGWSTFVGMLAYKARRHGRTFARVDRWFPSTRACSVCGAVGEARPLHVREWTCPCGAVHDRDVNAAHNILAAGRADSPTPVELVSAGTPVPQPVVKQEPAGSTA